MGSPSVLDQLQAGLLSRSDFRQKILDELYAGLHQYCDIPDGYDHCVLGSTQLDLESLDDRQVRDLLNHPPSEIVNPFPSQARCIELFELLLSGDSLVCDHADPLTPSVGAYLYGPPGSGKTHLMAAYAKRIKSQLDEKLGDVHAMLDGFIDDAYARFNARMATEQEANEPMGLLSLEGDEIKSELTPEDEFWQTISELRRRILAYEYQPTDLIYIGFKELFEVCRHSTHRTQTMEALEKARIVFIDDIHPQGDPEQVQLVLHLLERRYEMGRSGTFLTTNLLTHELGGGDEMLGMRLLSRCAETLLTIDFSDCEDWRRKVKSRKIQMVEDELDRRLVSRDSNQS
jgi:hypothetical protein